MGAFLKPNHLMGNYVTRELARGERQTPSYAPYTVADLPDAPLPVFVANRATSSPKREAIRHPSKPGAQQIPTHARNIYRKRFMMTADPCASWLTFDGLAAHLGNLSAVLYLAATEFSGASISRDTTRATLSSQLAELSRARQSY